MLQLKEKKLGCQQIKLKNFNICSVSFWNKFSQVFQPTATFLEFLSSAAGQISNWLKEYI